MTLNILTRLHVQLSPSKSDEVKYHGVDVGVLLFSA